MDNYIAFLSNKEYLKKPHVFQVGLLNGTQNNWSMGVKEGTILYNLCKELKPKIILEIGTFYGFSGVWAT